MKAIFALCLVLAFAFTQCTFTPKWFSCEWETWNTTNVTLDAAPVAGQNSTFTLCGENLTKEPEIFTGIRYKYDEYDIDHDYPIKKVIVGARKTHCFEVNIPVQNTDGEQDVYFAIDGDFFAAVGCDIVYLNIEGKKKKFLSS